MEVGPRSKDMLQKAPWAPTSPRRLGDQGMPKGNSGPEKSDLASRDVRVAVRPWVQSLSDSPVVEMELRRSAMLVSAEDHRPTTTMDTNHKGSRNEKPQQKVSSPHPAPTSPLPLRSPPRGTDLYSPPSCRQGGLRVAPRSPLEQTVVNLTQALSQCVLGVEWAGCSNAIVACEGGEKDF